jgi:GNAT superfamily N-acetyltransferase
MASTSVTLAQIRALKRPGDLGWVVMAHGEIYAAEFGWDASFEALVAQIVADYAREPEGRDRAAWIAELEGERVGCVFCVPGEDEGEARLRILLVDPRARGQSLGSRLVATAIEFARTAGFARMSLWTNHPLTHARNIYLKHGFRLVGEAPHRSFGTDLIGQTYELSLAANGEATPPA